jgi:hypothetical protein
MLAEEVVVVTKLLILVASLLVVQAGAAEVVQMVLDCQQLVLQTLAVVEVVVDKPLGHTLMDMPAALVLL